MRLFDRHRAPISCALAFAASFLAGCAVSGTGRAQPALGPDARASVRAAARRALPNAIALVPLYSYPASPSVWQPLVSGHAQAPSIPVDAIVDVTNLGPGKKIDENYLAGVQQLHAGGILALGYVDTAYGHRSLRAVENDIAHWKTWYGVDGIFLDVMASRAGHEAYYSNATAYAKSLELAPVIGNPGTDTSPNYATTVDALVIWEDASYPTLSYLGGGWHARYDRSHFGFIAYAQPTLNVSFDDAAEADVLYEYVTDRKVPNRYAQLPTYLDEFLSTL